MPRRALRVAIISVNDRESGTTPEDMAQKASPRPGALRGPGRTDESRCVAVAPVEGVAEGLVVERGEDLFDAERHRHLRGEIENGLHLREAHAIVARVGFLLDGRDGSAFAALLDRGDDV